MWPGKFIQGKSLTTGQAKLKSLAENGMSQSPERASIAKALSAARDTRCLEPGQGGLEPALSQWFSPDGPRPVSKV